LNSDSNYKVLKYISDILASENLEFWLEGGTALSAYRDGIIFKWEHDIDLAIWYVDLPKLISAINKFVSDGCKIRIQKGFPFIDNIIQLYLPQNITGSNPHLNQIDFYIYQQKDDFAYMRWFTSPSGKYSEKIKKFFFRHKRILLPAKHIYGKMSYFNLIIPKKIRFFYFKLFFHLYYKFGKCIYHIHPIKYFTKLKTINFYNIPFKIAYETENYLSHRYGPNWETPDSGFNSDFYKEKWKRIQARKELKFSILKKPKIDFKLQMKYINHLPDHMNEVP